jgi:protein involved in polysaccharide export with SLBB domain
MQRSFVKWRALVCFMAVMVATPIAAQRLDSSVPLGSPLRSSGSEQDSQERDSRSTIPVLDPTGGGSPVSREVIVDTERNLLNIDRSVAGASSLAETRIKPPAEPGEFERYVERVLGRRLPRFGTELIVPSSRDFSLPTTAAVPPDYILNVGDVISIYMTGSVEGSVEREIDNDGKIFLPKVGAIQLAGVRYADLKDRIAEAIGRQYRGYDVSVSIRRLRGIRVYVTGFANNPGAFTVSSLSTMANAVFAAGGPSSGGSFRSVKLYRHGQEVSDFDLYQLIRGGNRLNDVVLQNEDVLFIPPAGPQVAVIGSVNDEAIYEARPGETLDDILRYAGGANSLGDPNRVILYRNSDQQRVGPQELDRASAATVQVSGGDILQLLSKGTLIQPTDRQSVLVRIEGEVNRPGNYYVPPNTPLNQVMAMAGGLTSRAYPYGTRFTRQSVRIQQQDSYKEAISQLELTLAAAPLTADTSQSPGDRAAALAGARAVLEKLKTAKPDGRVVLDIAPNANVLPGTVLLENNDSIYVPPMSTTVGVFGAVYRPASFNIGDERPLRVKDYIERAGGTLRSADRGGIFVVRANGDVISKKRGALDDRVLPGDVIFVPVKTQSGGFWTKFKDITTTLFQLGLSAATITAVTK